MTPAPTTPMTPSFTIPASPVGNDRSVRAANQTVLQHDEKATLAFITKAINGRHTQTIAFRSHAIGSRRACCINQMCRSPQYISNDRMSCFTLDRMPTNRHNRHLFLFRDPMGPRRIVCLSEEPTETLYLLGEQERIVGIHRRWVL